MQRRDFLKRAAAGGVAVGAALGASRAAHAKAEYKWKMVTTWPKNFPGLGTGANKLAELITDMSGGRLSVKVYGAKELVPAFEVFDTVSSGTAEMGHGAAYYWKGKNEAFQFFSTVPFGLTANEMNGWLYYGGGMELWREAYAPFNVLPTAAGNTSVQMGGWFNKEINSAADLKGLKMRSPGLGGEVLKRLGGTPVNRSKTTNMVQSVIDIFNSRDKFIFAISPEGTRKRVSKWKTGFYHVALGAKVPIVMATLDFENKKIKIDEPYHLTGDQKTDFLHFHEYFKDVKGKNPEQFDADFHLNID